MPRVIDCSGSTFCRERYSRNPSRRRDRGESTPPIRTGWSAQSQSPTTARYSSLPKSTLCCFCRTAAVRTARIVAAGQHRRLNDGSTDPAGRFLVGTLSLGEPSDEEILVRLEPNGHLTVLDNDLTLSNGLAWSTDGMKMYSVDTNRQTIYVRDYDPTSGAVEIGGRTFGSGLVLPMASPWMSRTTSGWRSGARARSVDSHRTAPSRLRQRARPAHLLRRFRRRGSADAAITTATAELSDGDLADRPDSGRLFSVGTDVPGLPVPIWSGLSGPLASAR